MSVNAREPIALVGMACRFPGGANDKRKFWSLLRDKVDALTDIPSSRWDIEKFYHSDPDRPGRMYIRQGGFIHHPIEHFDAGFFEMSPREAAHLDPQQRLLLEVAWEAFEDAGVVVDAIAGSRTGVFVGGFMLDHYVVANSRDNRPLVDTYTSSGSSLTMLSARLAYAFDLRGPTISVDTACSSSLVATHYACTAIWNEECEMALVGGVNVILNPTMTVTLCKARLVSPDARCKAFDARANGYARGEGAGVVVLKPLRRALADNDRIYAVIRQTGVNQDGHSDNGITAPSLEAQEALVREVYTRAGIDPRQVGYVEAHGTGTALGDRTEAHALGRVIGAGRADSDRFFIGSVKTNVGHLEGAAGVAGLMKAALSIDAGMIPPNLHFETPNPQIPFADLRLRVPTEMEPWPVTDGPRTAGVSSFGYGGTNAHAILQSPPASARGPSTDGGESAALRAVPVSARSEAALRDRMRDLRHYLDTASDCRFEDLVYTLTNRRDHHQHRACLVASSVDELRGALDEAVAPDAEGFTTGRAPNVAPRGLVWVFTGMGPQWWGMGQALLDADAVFRSAIVECDHYLSQHADWSIVEEMRKGEGDSRMTETVFAQVGNFAVQIGLARVFARSGFAPSAVVGHSVGEVAAAYVAGAYTLEDAVRISYHRAALQASTAGQGKMLAVGMAETDAQKLLAHTERVSIAAINGPASLTLSGDEDELARVGRQLEEAGTFCKMLRVEVPYHSPAMDALEAPLLARVKSIRPQQPSIPLWSTVTGAPMAAADLGPGYWFRNIREPVRFARAITALAAEGYRDFLQLGPHPVLSAAIAECMASSDRKASVIASLHRKRPEKEALREAMSCIYAAGYNPRAPENGAKLIDLPSYPWQREHLWSEPKESLAYRLPRDGHPLLGARADSGTSWASDLGRACLDYLRDHVIQKQVLLPASGYVEAALQMVREVCGEGALTLRDVRFVEAMILDASKSSELRSSFDPSTGRLSICSDDAGAPHATAWGYAVASDAGSRIDLDALRARLEEGAAPDALYQQLRSRGYDYGPAFQGIQQCWSRGRETLARIQMPAEIEAAFPEYILHPAALDVCFHSFIAGIDARAASGTLFLPIGIEEMTVHAPIRGQLWCHARFVEDVGGMWRIHLDICDEEGRPLAAIKGLQIRKVRSSTILESRRYRDWMFGADWIEASACEEATAEGTWLVFGEAGDALSEAVVEHLRRAGARPRLVSRESARGAITIDPEDPEAYARLLRDTDDLSGAAFLWSAALDENSDRISPVHGEQASVALCCLIQALREKPRLGRPRVAVVTRAVHRVHAGDAPAAPSAGLVAGFLRVAINEYRDLELRMIDLQAQVRGEDPAVVVGEILARDGEEESAYRDGKRFVFRFTPMEAERIRRAKMTTRSAEDARFAIDPSPEEGGPAVYREAAPRAIGPTEVELRVLGTRIEGGIGLDGIGPGLGCTGRITAVGRRVSRYRVGDEVIAWQSGTLRSHVVVDEGLIALLPDGVSPVDATAFTSLAGAAYALEEQLRAREGDSLLAIVDDAVWLAALGQVARDLGVDRLFVLSADRTIEKPAIVDGLAVTFLDPAADLGDVVREATNGRALDGIVHVFSGFGGGLWWRRLTAALASGGRLVAVDRDAGELAVSAARNITVCAVALETLATDQPRTASRILARVSEKLRAGDWKLPAIDAITPAEALHAVSRGATSIRFDGASIDMSSDPARLVRADAGYVITGGFGGLGTAFAHWLVDRGARTLFLLGRRGAASPEAARKVAELEARGARVVAGAVDVADEGALRDFLSRQGAHPPIAGAAHTAASFDEDALISNTTADQLRRAVRAKAHGAYALSRALDGCDLDFLLLFSSVASHTGSVGLASYSAGNAYLDALAAFLHARGIPAYSIGFGAVSDVGVLAREAHFAEATGRSGNIAEPIAALFEPLDHLLVTNRPGWIVANIDWSTGARMFPAFESPRFERLWDRAHGAEADGDLSHRLRQMKGPDRIALLCAQLRDVLAELFGTSSERIDPAASIKSLGIDSLMAVQLQLAIERLCGVQVEMMAVLKGPSSLELAEMLSDKIDAAAIVNDDALLAAVDEKVLAAELAKLGV